MIENFAKKIPSELRNKSGKVFYSGRVAFSKPGKLYILGLNPGGDPIKQSGEAVGWHTRKVLGEKPDNWSEYRDESWRGRPPGQRGMQPRILHLLEKLALDPGTVAASNIIFLRSRREANIKNEINRLAETCWPFHQAVIESIRPRVILCLGGRAGDFVKRKTGAGDLVDCFVENNERRWKSTICVNRDGLKIITASHPSIADWTNPDTDPSELIKQALKS